MPVSKQLLLEYLHNHFNPAIGLCCEAPRVKPKWYWCRIDNMLAMGLLNSLGEFDFASEISDGIDRYRPPPHGRVEVLFGLVQKEPWLAAQKFAFNPPDHWEYVPDPDNSPYANQVTVLTEEANGAVIPNPNNYADLLAYSIINRILKGGWWNTFMAKWLLAQLRAMWDGTGMNDAIHKNTGWYNTYKLALLAYTCSRMKVSVPSGVLDRLMSLQEQNQDKYLHRGGFYTDYEPNGDTSQFDTNTETSSFAGITLIKHGLM